MLSFIRVYTSQHMLGCTNNNNEKKRAIPDNCLSIHYICYPFDCGRCFFLNFLTPACTTAYATTAAYFCSPVHGGLHGANPSMPPFMNYCSFMIRCWFTQGSCSFIWRKFKGFKDFQGYVCKFSRTTLSVVRKPTNRCSGGDKGLK